ncbi:hypothetical protein V1T76_28845 [Roseibium sp. FZY0029]|uniref:hypothetical protein n=1 Tax=Roseibium sp. FZY0029 TaxID=3116647 RepID=UPI002E98530B|nr:hypothetical protein [Roseibium sp. FZY0029]
MGLNICFNGKTIIKIIFTFIIFLIFETHVSIADSEKPAACPDQWSAVVRKVTQELAALDETGAHKTVFVGSDGKIFNCLSEDIPQLYLQKSEEFEASKLSTFSNEKENGIPSFYCVISKITNNYNIINYKIYLPYDVSDLNSDICKKLLNGSMDLFWRKSDRGNKYYYQKTMFRGKFDGRHE